MRISQIVEDIGDLLVNRNGLFIILDCLLRFTQIILGICKTNDSLKLFWVVLDSLLEVFGGCV